MDAVRCPCGAGCALLVTAAGNSWCTCSPQVRKATQAMEKRQDNFRKMTYCADVSTADEFL